MMTHQQCSWPMLGFIALTSCESQHTQNLWSPSIEKPFCFYAMQIALFHVKFESFEIWAIHNASLFLYNTFSSSHTKIHWWWRFNLVLIFMCLHFFFGINSSQISSFQHFTFLSPFCIGFILHVSFICCVFPHIVTVGKFQILPLPFTTIS